MKGASMVMALVLSLLAVLHCVIGANVIHVGISRTTPDLGALARDLKGNILTRATVVSDLYNNMTHAAAYMASVSVGTPGQALSLVIDTGSSDTFILSKADSECSDIVSANTYGQCIGGTYDSSASSTFVTISRGGFRIKYVDQTQSYGDYISDNFEIGGLVISALQMGLAIDSTVGVGIMGIGYQAGESVTLAKRYPNLIDQMVAQKLINLRAYSLYLEDRETAQGSILFGGIDTEKFLGNLKVLPIQENPRTNSTDSFIVELTSTSVIRDNVTTPLVLGSTSVLVILDSGTTLTYLPASMFDAIIKPFGAIDDSNNSGFVFIDCDLRTSSPNDFISYGFGGNNDGPVIRVPLRELLLDINVTSLNTPFTNTCDFGMRAADFSVFLLGDTFLRSAYVVYDIDHNQIALAQTNFEASGSNIMEIPSDSVSIPLLSGQASPSSIQVLHSAVSTSFVTSSSGLETFTLAGTGNSAAATLSAVVSSKSFFSIDTNSNAAETGTITGMASSPTVADSATMTLVAPNSDESLDASQTVTSTPTDMASSASLSFAAEFLKYGSLDFFISNTLLLTGAIFFFVL